MLTLDEKDHGLLDALRQDARKSIVDLARTIGLSRTATHDRLMRLEERQIIRGYTVIVDDTKVQRARAFFAIQITDGTASTAIEAAVMSKKEIAAAYHLSGDVDLILQADAQTGSDLLDLREELAELEGIASIKTYAIMRGGTV